MLSLTGKHGQQKKPANAGFFCWIRNITAVATGGASNKKACTRAGFRNQVMSLFAIKDLFTKGQLFLKELRVFSPVKFIIFRGTIRNAFLLFIQFL